MISGIIKVAARLISGGRRSSLITLAYILIIPDITNPNSIIVFTITTEIQARSLADCYYYSFKIFSCFWLVKTTRIIHHNQLLFTKFGKNLLHQLNQWRQKCCPPKVIEPMTSKWRQNDVKSAARCRLSNCWQIKPEDKVVLYSVRQCDDEIHDQ